jgi:hypothetical protein
MNLKFINQTNQRGIWCDREVSGSLYHDTWEDLRCPCSRNTWHWLQSIHDQRNQWDDRSSNDIAKFKGWCPCPTVVHVDAGLPAKHRVDSVKVALTGGNVQCSTTEDDYGPKINFPMSRPVCGEDCSDNSRRRWEDYQRRSSPAKRSVLFVKEWSIIFSSHRYSLQWRPNNKWQDQKVSVGNLVHTAAEHKNRRS